MSQEVAEEGFNSIVVRLKVPHHHRERGQKNQFQFHSGSIKSEDELFFDESGYQFQFHSGSIKSGAMN